MQLRAIEPEYLEILKNKEIIDINQDPVVGESITPFRWGINVRSIQTSHYLISSPNRVRLSQPDWVSNTTHPAQYWSGNTKDGVVFMLINTLDEASPMFFNLTESWAIRAGRQYSVRDLWAHTDNGTAVRNLTVTVPAHGVSALLLKDAGDEPAAAGDYNECAVWWQCTAEDGTRVGG